MESAKIGVTGVATVTEKAQRQTLQRKALVTLAVTGWMGVSLGVQEHRDGDLTAPVPAHASLRRRGVSTGRGEGVGTGVGGGSGGLCCAGVADMALFH